MHFIVFSKENTAYNIDPRYDNKNNVTKMAFNQTDKQVSVEAAPDA